MRRAICLLEILNVDLLLGNHLERFVDGRHQLVDQTPRSLDVKFQRHFLPHGVTRGRPGRAGITHDVPSEHQRSERHDQARPEDGFL